MTTAKPSRVTWYQASYCGVYAVKVIVLGDGRLDVGAGVTQPQRSMFGDYFECREEAEQHALAVMKRKLEGLYKDVAHYEKQVKKLSAKMGEKAGAE